MNRPGVVQRIVRHIPLLSKEGWLRHQLNNRFPLRAQTGWLSIENHPVRSRIMFLRRSAAVALLLSSVFLAAPSKPASVLLPGTSPLVTFRILFTTGSAFDPPGKEGIAALTASMLAEGGTRSMTYDQIVQALYPMASSINAQVDKEMTVFTGTSHIENLDRYYSLLKDMLLDPGFRTEDFNRLRTDAINFLKVSLRESNDEELSKEHLYNVIYSGHPYGHDNTGRVSSLEKLTPDDVRDFYHNHYTAANLVIGLAGGYPKGFAEKVEADFAKLPAGPADKKHFEAPKAAPGTHLDIITRDTRSTAISLGFPIDVNRSSKDWAALTLVASYLGQHRSSNSYLYQRLREARGLNYGDYAYIEYFPRGMFLMTPEPNLARQQQIFQIWIRPVEQENGVFALRAALYEYDKLVRDGLSQQAFDTTREFLTKFANVLTQSQSARLGYTLDSRYYGIPDYNSYLRTQLAKLTLADVNAAIRRHLKTDSMRIVVVTRNGDAFRDAVVNNTPSPITYNSPKPKEIMDEDKVIQVYKINVRPEDARIVPVTQIFQ
jgi:zinc protease